MKKKVSKKEMNETCDWGYSDMALTKLAVGSFVLMIADLWSGILGLPWYIYLVIAVLAAIKPMRKGHCCCN